MLDQDAEAFLILTQLCFCLIPANEASDLPADGLEQIKDVGIGISLFPAVENHHTTYIELNIDRNPQSTLKPIFPGLGEAGVLCERTYVADPLRFSGCPDLTCES